MRRGSGAVLLVEDDPNDVLLLRRALAAAGLDDCVHVVVDGEQAVAYFSGEGEYADRSRHPLPTLVLLDLKLPRRSGLEVLAWLREQPGLRRLRVVVLTSSSEIADINQAHELGANSYLVKPVSYDTLTDMVGTTQRYWLELAQAPDVP